MQEEWRSPRGHAPRLRRRQSGPDEGRDSGQGEAQHRPGTPCWVSLMVHDLAATQEFYGALFGWTFTIAAGQSGPYVRALADGRAVAGIGTLPSGRRLPVSWTTYLASDDADATAELVRCCGGTVGVGPLDSGERGAAGRLVICSDPTGAVFGVWQAGRHHGAEPGGEPGTFVWNELLTRETSTPAAFYPAVFGYDAGPADSGDGRDRHTLRLDGWPVAGIRGLGNALPRDRGSHWMTYFEVADTEVAARTVTALGGRVVRQPHDAEKGRVATVTDPEGAVFGIVQTA